MEDFWRAIQEWLTSSTGAALTIGLVLFIVTMILTSLRWIGFGITFLLLLFTLVSAVVVANLDFVRKCFDTPRVEHISEYDVKISTFQEQTLKSIDSLKAEVEIQKHKVQVLTEELETLKKKPPKEAS